MRKTCVCRRVLYNIRLKYAHLEHTESTLLPWTSQVTYAEEQVECRRVQLLQHFGEHFNPVECRGTCDVCKNREAAGMDYEMQDQEAAGMDCETHVRAESEANTETDCLPGPEQGFNPGLAPVGARGPPYVFNALMTVVGSLKTSMAAHRAPFA
eukprot:1137554-Pelagomonas_calceolata.AAC.10